MDDPRRTARLAGALWLVVIAASVVPVAILGEGALTLWLLVKGVNVP